MGSINYTYCLNICTFVVSLCRLSVSSLCVVSLCRLSVSLDDMNNVRAAYQVVVVVVNSVRDACHVVVGALDIVSWYGQC